MNLSFSCLTALVLLLNHQAYCTNDSVYSSIPTLDTDEETERNVRSLKAPTKRPTSSLDKSLKLACDYIGWSLPDCLTETMVDGCNKEGTIPSEIGLLTNLDFLAIWDASGTIPSTIGQLTKLEHLDVSCGFDTSKLYGKIPTTIGKLTKLDTIYFHDCRLTGTIPVAIGRLTKLTRISMKDSKFKSPIPNVSGLTSLMSLTLSNNSFTGKLPNSLAQLRKLTTLDIKDNSFSGPLPLWLQKMSLLNDLHVDNNMFSGDLKALGKLTNLESFSASGNEITGSIPNTLGKLMLITLDLSKNYLSGTIPKLLRRFYNLNISHNMLTGTMPSSLYLSETVDVSKNMLTGAFGKLYSNNPDEEKYAISRLYLSDNLLTGTIAQSMIYLTNLIDINLSKNQLTGPLPEFQTFWRLNVLVLSQNSFTGTISKSLGDMKLLQRLDLSYNQLTGSIPSSIAKLTALRTAYFDNNVLIGSISDKFCARTQDDGYPKIAVDFEEVTCQCCTSWHEE